MAKISITLDTQDGVDPFSVHTSRSKRTKIRLLANLLRALAGGGATPRASLRFGTAQASATATLVTAVAGNVLTINGKAVTAIQLHSRGTATLDTVVEDDSLSINDTTFVAKDEATAGSYTEFTIGASDTTAAAALAVAINAHPDLSGVVTATSAVGVVTIRAYDYGVAGDDVALEETGDSITLSNPTLTGGAAPSGDQWDYGDTDTQGAASLAAAIVRSTTALVQYQVTATSALGVVTVTAQNKGLAGNAVSLAKTGVPITLAGVTAGLMTGGTESVVSI